jgi:hypothetical protein
MGGALQLESDLGKGSRFIVKLRRAVEEMDVRSQTLAGAT